MATWSYEYTGGIVGLDTASTSGYLSSPKNEFTSYNLSDAFDKRINIISVDNNSNTETVKMENIDSAENESIHSETVPGIYNGSRVLLKESSRYKVELSNPKIGSRYECYGTVTNIITTSSILDKPIYSVRWDNGRQNAYSYNDLVLKEELEPQVVEGCNSIW